jgi:transcriptional regulator
VKDVLDHMKESAVTDTASTNLVRGTVDLVVLRTLTQGPMHGFSIARWIRDRGGEVVSFEDAALYQSLHRLERQGLVASSWGRSENNRRARFYTLTAKGRGRLETETSAFHSYAKAIARLLETGS